MNVLPYILACATCLPDQSTDVARASNMAILFMIAVVFSMFGVILTIMFNFARKQRTHQDLVS
jgi:heme/copper-type cytochrome/quinol oxidase subunit 2